MGQKKRKPRKPNKRKGRPSQEALAKGMSHPARAQALAILSERRACPRDIAEEIGVPLGTVSYHVRVLDDLGLVELSETEPAGGSVAHYYKAVRWEVIDLSAWERLDAGFRGALSGSTIEALVSDAVKSLSAGLFDKRRDRHLSRTSLLLDERAWRRVLKIQAEAKRKILEEQEAASRRIADSGDPGFTVVAAMTCFEVPPQDAEDQ